MSAITRYVALQGHLSQVLGWHLEPSHAGWPLISPTGIDRQSVQFNDAIASPCIPSNAERYFFLQNLEEIITVISTRLLIE